MHLYEHRYPAEEHATQVQAEGEAASDPTIRLNPADDVVIARRQLQDCTPIPLEGIVASHLVPAGHKIATRRISAGEPVRRYSQIIGVATRDIEPGQHVHTHNLGMAEFARDYAFCADA